MLRPSFQIWLILIYAKSICILTEDLFEFLMFKNFFCWFFCKFNSSIRKSFTFIQSKFMLFNSAICILFFLYPERYQTNYNLVYFPDWVPGFWMIIRNWKANTFSPIVESSILSYECDFWSFSRIVIRTNYFTQVVSTFKIGMVNVKYNIVPYICIFRVRETNEAVL